MRFARDPFVIERRYRLDPALLKPGAAPDAPEQTLLVPLRALHGDFADCIIFLADTTERMWQLIVEGRDLDTIAEIIATEYEIDPKTARDDLAKLVGQLRERSAIVPI